MAVESRQIIGMRVDATTYTLAADQILEWAQAGCGRMVCCACVHMAMECFDRMAYRKIINDADLVTPDGMPLVWTLRRLGVPDATRIYGPDLTRILLGVAEKAGLAVGFYGGTPETLNRLLAVAAKAHPQLHVAYACAPPFRPVSGAEDIEVVDAIRASGARLLFVGLGCPKQEVWMAAHRDRLDAVLLGVGAAFDFIAGTKPQAPAFVQRAGCEWLFRLTVEPKRLWRRYLTNNPRFLFHCGAQILGRRTELSR